MILSPATSLLTDNNGDSSDDVDLDRDIGPAGLVTALRESRQLAGIVGKGD